MKFKYLILLFSLPLLVSCKSSFMAIERHTFDNSDEAFMCYLKSENIAITDSNRVDILNGAHAKFERMLQDINEAKHHIHL